MKKYLLMCLTFFSFSVAMAQLKVFSTGQTLLGTTTNSMTGNMQFNVTSGTSNGITFNNTTWNQMYRLTFDDYTWSLTNTQNSSEMGFYEQGYYFGNSYYSMNYGLAAVNIMPLWTGTNYGTCALYVGNPFADGKAAILSRNTSTSTGGVSIASIVRNNTGITFASAKSNSSYNFNYTYYVYGNGEVYAQSIYTTSDSTRKTNIRDIESPLDKILRLRGVKYQYKTDAATISDEITTVSSEVDTVTNDVMLKSSAKVQLPDFNSTVLQQIEKEQKEGVHMGFLAQEVERVLPEVVRTSLDGTKSLSYMEIIALLVEGMKEQQQVIGQLQNDIENIKQTIGGSIEGNAPVKRVDSTIITEAVLYQNAPNPFDNITTIRYLLPEDVQNAAIFIYDMNGGQLAKFNISTSSTELVIDGNTLQAGMYLYSLIADGQIIDTKRMILTK